MPSAQRGRKPALNRVNGIIRIYPHPGCSLVKPEWLVRWFVAFGWAVVAISQYAVDLRLDLRTWDEQIYYNVARNVLDGHWLLPRFTLESHPIPVTTPFLHKPPLAYWIQATAMALGGETPAAARWPSVLAMAAVVGLTVLLAWQLSGPITGFLAGGLLIPISAMSATHAANHVATDPFLLVFGVAAIYALVVAVRRDAKRWWVLAGIGYGLAILSKGVAAAPFGLFVLPYLASRRTEWDWRNFGTMVAAGLLVSLPWFVAVLLLAPSELIHQMFTRQVLHRATGQAYATQQGTFGFMRYPYLREAPRYFSPTSYVVPLSLLLTVHRFARSGRFRDIELLCWPLCLGTIVLYAAVGGNHIWYLLPVAVPVALLAADATARLVTIVLDSVTTWIALYSNRRRFERL